MLKRKDLSRIEVVVAGSWIVGSIGLLNSGSAGAVRPGWLTRIGGGLDVSPGGELLTSIAAIAN